MKITWSIWGATNALGRGLGFYVSPSEDTAQGSITSADVVAFRLGSCNGHWVYGGRRVVLPRERRAIHA
jgi:hypothetical protein